MKTSKDMINYDKLVNIWNDGWRPKGPYTEKVMRKILTGSMAFYFAKQYLDTLERAFINPVVSEKTSDYKKIWGDPDKPKDPQNHIMVFSSGAINPKEILADISELKGDLLPPVAAFPFLIGNLELLDLLEHKKQSLEQSNGFWDDLEFCGKNDEKLVKKIIHPLERYLLKKEDPKRKVVRSLEVLEKIHLLLLSQYNRLYQLCDGLGEEKAYAWLNLYLFEAQNGIYHEILPQRLYLNMFYGLTEEEYNSLDTNGLDKAIKYYQNKIDEIEQEKIKRKEPTAVDESFFQMCWEMPERQFYEGDEETAKTPDNDCFKLDIMELLEKLRLAAFLGEKSLIPDEEKDSFDWIMGREVMVSYEWQSAADMILYRALERLEGGILGLDEDSELDVLMAKHIRGLLGHCTKQHAEKIEEQVQFMIKYQLKGALPKLIKNKGIDQQFCEMYLSFYKKHGKIAEEVFQRLPHNLIEDIKEKQFDYKMLQKIESEIGIDLDLIKSGFPDDQIE